MRGRRITSATTKCNIMSSSVFSWWRSVGFGVGLRNGVEFGVECLKSALDLYKLTLDLALDFEIGVGQKIQCLSTALESVWVYTIIHPYTHSPEY